MTNHDSPLGLGEIPACRAQGSVSKEERSGGENGLNVREAVMYPTFHCTLRHKPTVSPGESHYCNDEDESFLVLIPKTLDTDLVLPQKHSLVFNITSLPTLVGFLMLSHIHPCFSWILSEPPRSVSCDKNNFYLVLPGSWAKNCFLIPSWPVCSQAEHIGWALTVDVIWLAS